MSAWILSLKNWSIQSIKKSQKIKLGVVQTKKDQPIQSPSTPHLNVYVADSRHAIKEHYKKPSGIDSVVVSASAGGKYFLLEASSQRKMTPTEKRTVHIYLDQLLVCQLKQRNINFSEIEKVVFTDSQYLPDYIPYKYSELVRL